VEVEESIAEVVEKECFLKVVVKLGSKEKIDVPMYEVNLDTE